MKQIRWKYWVTGTLIAFAGVALVKWGPLIADHAAVTLLGYSLSILGLFVIMLGTRRGD